MMSRLLKNARGRMRGYSGCLKCGDTWDWKKNHIIEVTEHAGMFPYCEECHKTMSLDKKHKYIDELAFIWDSQIPLDDERKKYVELAHQIVSSEGKNK